MDWIEEFKSKSLEEMEREIEAYKYYLPLPWYRFWAQLFISGGIMIGTGGGFLSCIVIASVYEDYPVTWILLIPFLLMGWAFVSLGLMSLYDKLTSDPLSIIEDPKLIREGLEAGHEYTRIDKPTGPIGGECLDLTKISMYLDTNTECLKLENSNARDTCLLAGHQISSIETMVE